MPTKNINNVRDYLTAPFAAFLQIADHPALPITLTAVSSSWQPLFQTHGKDFASVEHLFHHYNKYNAGSTLNRQLYLKDNSQRLLQYIIFQEGPYSKLSVAQTLELSPAEWAEMPALAQIDATPNTVTHEFIAPVPAVSPDAPPLEKTRRLADLKGRCDGIERSLNEMRRKSLETDAQIDKICLAVDNLNSTIRTLQNVIKTINTRTRLV